MKQLQIFCTFVCGGCCVAHFPWWQHKLSVNNRTSRHHNQQSQRSSQQTATSCFIALVPCRLSCRFVEVHQR